MYARMIHHHRIESFLVCNDLSLNSNPTHPLQLHTRNIGVRTEGGNLGRGAGYNHPLAPVF